jgi:hypothetical protein
LADLRERRTIGCALLRNFLERSVGVTVADIVRVPDRFNNLMERMAAFTSNMQTELTERNWQATRQEARKQSRFLAAAETLVYVGGAYYLFSLIRGVIEFAGRLDQVVTQDQSFGIVVLLFLCCFAAMHFLRKFAVEFRRDMLRNPRDEESG